MFTPLEFFFHMLVRKAFTRTLPGVRVKDVDCEHCGQHYSYLLRRSLPDARVNLWAARCEEYIPPEVRVELDAWLNGEFDCVPCPSCGDYQADMRARVEAYYDRKKRSGSKFLGIGLFVSSFFGIVVSAFALDFGTARDHGNLIAVAIAGVVFCAVALIVGIGLLWPRQQRADQFSISDEERRAARIAEGRRREREVREFLAGDELSSAPNDVN